MKCRGKRWMAILLAVLMISALPGCTGGTESESSAESQSFAGSAAESSEEESSASEESDEEDKVITFWNLGTEDPDKTIMGFAPEKFNAENDKGYTVEVVATQNDNYKEKLVVAMSSGECPDMYTSWTGGPLVEYINSGFAQPIDDLFYASELPDRFMEGAITQGTYDGHIYAIPVININVTGIYYNKEMFDNLGLTAPTTISELEAVCDQLLANGITPFAMANLEKWVGSYYFMNLATRYGGIDPFVNAANGDGSFEDECFIKAGQTLKEWTEKGYFPEGMNSMSWNDGMGKQLFYQETTAMMLVGSGMGSTIMNDSEEFFNKLDWIPFPVDDTNDVDPSLLIGTLGDQFISFNCTGEKLEAAFECVTYYLSPEGVQLMVDKGKIPPIKGIEDQITNPLLQKVVKAANEASNMQLFYDQYLPPAVAQVHLDTLQEVFGLTMEPEEAARRMQEANEEYLAERDQ